LRPRTCVREKGAVPGLDAISPEAGSADRARAPRVGGGTAQTLPTQPRLDEGDHALPKLDYRPRFPENRSRGIGIIGLGGIVQFGHLPAYRAAGYRVVAGADISQKAVEQVRGPFGIEHLSTDYRRVLDDPQVEVVDIALPNTVADRERIILEAIDAGKHLLVQKPFAHEFEQAQTFVRAAEEAGVLLAVNQNARWNPSYRASSSLIDQGELGELYLITHEMRVNQDTEYDSPWWMQLARPLFLEYSVHHFDILRMWARREPVRVNASVVRRPGQRYRGEMIGITTLEFDGLVASIVDDDASFSEDPLCRFRIEGTTGLVNGTVGMFGPLGTGNGPGTIEFCRRGAPLFYRPLLEGAWAPDAFAATMGELLIALEEGRQPEISGRDNLNTLRIALAAELSARDGGPISPSEIR
jgi:predicted dehydrogenase